MDESPASPRIYVSAPVDRYLPVHQMTAKDGIRNLLVSKGLDLQEFGRSGLPEQMEWNADSSLEVMRRCDGALVLAFSRFTLFNTEGAEHRLPTEYNHYEGALALALGLPTFVLSDQGLRPRGILHPACGVPIVTLPPDAGPLWILEPSVQEPLTTWIQAVHRRRRFHSCFISYSSRDEEFCQRLYSGLQRAGLKVWFAPQDIKAGQKIHEQVTSAIERYDKLLLVLSERSLKSDWVEHEIRTARKREVQQKRRVLFPIRLVDYTAIEQWSRFDADTKKDLAAEVREYYIPDFSAWEDSTAFSQAFGKLLDDLKSEGEPPAG